MNNTFQTSKHGLTSHCSAVADLLPLLEHPGLDAEDAAAVRAHLAACPACQAQQAAIRRLEQDARRFLSPAGTSCRHRTEDLLAAIQQEVPVEAHPGSPPPLTRRAVRLSKPGPVRSFVSGLAPVTTVLVIVLLAIALFSRHGLTGTPGGAVTPPPALGSQTELRAIAMVSPSEGWAIGWSDASLSDPNGAQVLVLHDQNGVWSPVHVPIHGQLDSISMVSATDGWAGGTAGLLHYNGKTWKQIQPYAHWGTLRIQMLSATDGWATGDAGILLHYDGHSWMRQPLPESLTADAKTSVMLWGLSMTSSDDGWVIGDQVNNATGMTERAVLLHYTHGQWQVGQRIEGASLASISMVSPEEGWALGGISTASQSASTPPSPTSPLLLHYTQGQWVQVANPLSSPVSSSEGVVVMRSASDGWMAGIPDTIGIPPLLHYNGSTWSKVSLPLTRDQNTDRFEITGLALTSADDGWAVGVRISNANQSLPLDSGGDNIPTVTPLLLHDTAGTWSVVQS
jgi:hypothetical protein